MERIAVFCGSRDGESVSFRLAAASLGTLLAQQSIGIVYGGSKNGLMGALADAALAADGEVIGILPSLLADRELAHKHLTELRLVDSMATRKSAMAEASDAFVVLPGGFGTLDEMFEMITWNQLKLQAKPVGILNIEGYFDPLMSMIYQQVKQGFVPHQQLDMLIDAPTPEALFGQLSDVVSRIKSS